jgi:uncharacterized protein
MESEPLKNPATDWLPVSEEVFHTILRGYDLSPMGIHGLPHWGRVFENGRRLASDSGADPRVLDLFALFHDARRRNEHHDDGHGARGADLARELRAALSPLSDCQFDLLCEACEHHTDGLTHPDPTIGACWDADRLDLWRVGITPVEAFLSTEVARDPGTLTWAEKRSSRCEIPPFVVEMGVYIPRIGLPVRRQS